MIETVPFQAFTLPDDLSATEPPEERGLERDGVRLLVARPGNLEHARFYELPRFLSPGDLVVVNTSATLAAAVGGFRDGGRAVVVHFSAPLDYGTWVIEMRAPDGSGPVLQGLPGEALNLPGGVQAILLAAHPDRNRTRSRLWRARLVLEGPVEAFLAHYGRPITYGYLRARPALASYQSVFARYPGSAEMASAGRPFTHALVTELLVRGVAVAPLLLHSGVSSLEKDEAPQPERFRVPEATARLVNHARASGGRVVAVGTTVARALESVAGRGGEVVAGQGWTELVLGPGRPARVLGGLITGWHAPGSSHLELLAAAAGPRLVREAYDAALEAGYLWHEFGDSALFLP